VHFHHPTAGSRDIDILFPERKLKDVVVSSYLGSHGYKSEGLFTKEYFKEVDTPRGKERIIIDACSVEDVNRLKKTDIVIPWTLAFEHPKRIKTEDIELYIPDVEVLLLYKSKAALDRKEDLKEVFDPFYLQQKILKDHYDIINLVSNCGIDFDILDDLLSRCNFHEQFTSVFADMETKKEMDVMKGRWKEIRDEFLEQLGSTR
jgi:hypothetical protein